MIINSLSGLKYRRCCPRTDECRRGRWAFGLNTGTGRPEMKNYCCNRHLFQKIREQFTWGEAYGAV